MKHLIAAALALPLLATPLIVNAQTPAAPAQTIVAQGAGVALTQDNAQAYFEAVDFCLLQIGEAPLDAQTKQTLFQNLLSQYPVLDIETQVALANARQTFSQYQAQWAFLDLRTKQEFGASVLGLIYGPETAARAVGLPVGGGSSGGSFGGVDVDGVGGGCGGGHCESMGDGTVDYTPNE